MRHGDASHGLLLIDVRLRRRGPTDRRRDARAQATDAAQRIASYSFGETVSAIASRVRWIPPARRSRHLFVFFAIGPACDTDRRRSPYRHPTIASKWLQCRRSARGARGDFCNSACAGKRCRMWRVCARKTYRGGRRTRDEIE
ncbi:hypothetical protein BURMUCGD1_4345 [Burkholderia multivorans CGD1]|nr:hypothetical protein BURMUCGD1_4345 [Burkholderia multivorans CGD1]